VLNPEEFGPRYQQARTIDALRELVADGGYGRAYQESVLIETQRLIAEAGGDPPWRAGAEEKIRLYFDAVGDWLLGTTSLGLGDLPRGERVRDDGLARLIRDAAGDTMHEATSRADAFRIATCGVMNLAAAEGCSYDNERLLWIGWPRAATEPAAADVMLSILQQEGATLAEAMLREYLALVASPRWEELPAHGASIAGAGVNVCRTCGRVHHAPYWNFIAYEDRALREAVARGELHRYACPFCGSPDIATIGTVPSVAASATYLTSRLVCCTTHYGAVILAPPELAPVRVDAGLAIGVIAGRWIAFDPRELPRTDLVVFGRDEFAGLVREALPSDDPPGVEYALFFYNFLRPFVAAIRSGRRRLEDVEAYLARELERRPDLRPPGLVLRRFDSHDPDSALFLGLMATLYERSGQLDGAVLALSEGAVQAGTASRPSEAMWLLDRAQRLIDAHPDVDGTRHDTLQRRISIGRGHIHCLLGNHQEGIAELERGVELTRKSSDPEERPNLAAALSYLGAEVSQFDLARGHVHLSEALAICDELLAGKLEPHIEQFLLHTRSGALSNLGKLYQNAQLIVVIAHAYAVPNLPIPEVVKVASLVRSRGWSVDSVGRNMEFIQSLYTDSPDLAFTLDQRKMELYHEAYDIASKHGFHAYAAIQATNISEALVPHHQDGEAETWARRAEQHAEESGDTEALVIASTRLADSFTQNGRIVEAREGLRRAYATWMNLRRNVVTDHLRVVASETIEPLAGRIVAALEGADAAEWMATLETMKAGALADAMLRPPLRVGGAAEPEGVGRLADLEREIASVQSQMQVPEDVATAPDLAPLRERLDELRRDHDAERERLLLRNPGFSRWFENAPAAFPEGGALLATLHERHGDAAVVGMWVTGDEALLYGTRRGAQPWTHRIPLLARLREASGGEWRTIADFTRAYRETLFALSASGDEEAFREQFAAPLYRALWSELEPLLGGASHVVLSPHSDLYAMPWGTLWDGRQYLASRVDVSQVFSLTLPSSSSPPGARTRLLLIVNPTLDLSGTEAEAAAIATWVPEGVACDVISREDATVGRFLDAAPGANVVHLACHAQFDPDSPWDSALLLHGAQLTMATIADQADLRAADLVVLSACETGLADIRGGEALGLTRSFYFAGAHNVIASLWRVDDDATALLMERLYAHLLSGNAPPAVALGAAQRDLLELSPFAWGAFVHYTL
jgi:tetratricopeptide (TPR) repeat protein